VVTKDIEPYAIVAGNPARKVGERAVEGRGFEYELDYQPWLM
jgi:acetyltransferase-like isoleucine patch superfamily enzyme